MPSTNEKAEEKVEKVEKIEPRKFGKFECPHPGRYQITNGRPGQSKTDAATGQLIEVAPLPAFCIVVPKKMEIDLDDPFVDPAHPYQPECNLEMAAKFLVEKLEAYPVTPEIEKARQDKVKQEKTASTVVKDADDAVTRAVNKAKRDAAKELNK